MAGTLSVLRTAAGWAARARDLFGMEGETLDPVALDREAARRSLRTEPLTEDVAEALGTLCRSLDEEAGLDAFGRLAARSDILGKLVSLRRMDAAERRDPAIATRAVAAPIVITGLPRSGTSFLHALLARHDALRAPETWRVVDPFSDDGDAARTRVARQLRVFGHLVPELASLHPLDADAPQECSEILGHVFRSLRFETTFSVPRYRAWLSAAGIDGAYRFHRRFLRHLQNDADGARWVLKSPDHVFCLPALRRTYPDAVLVFVHRDPARVLASVARLTELLRTPFARGVDRVAIGRQVAGDWLRGMDLIIAEADRDPGILHIRHEDLVADPVDAAERVLDRSGIARTERGTASMARHVAAHPGGGYGRNRYTLGDYGVAEGDFAARRDAYRARFGLTRSGSREDR